MGPPDNEQNSKSPSNKWRKYYSKSKPGKFYYYNVKTRATSWTLPDGAVLEDFRGSPQSKTKAPSKRKYSSDISAQVKVIKKVVLPSSSEEISAGLQGSQLNDDSSVKKRGEPRISGTISSEDSTNALPSNRKERKLQNYTPNQVINRNISNTLPPRRESCSSKDNLALAPTRKKRRKKRNKKLLGSAALTFLQAGSSGTSIKSSEPCMVESVKPVSSSEGKTKDHFISLCQSIVSSISCKSIENTQCVNLHQTNKNKEIPVKQNTGVVVCENDKRTFPLSNSLEANQDECPISHSRSVYSSTDAMAPNPTCLVSEGSGKDKQDMPQTKFSSNLTSPISFKVKVLSSSAHNIPMKSDARAETKYFKDISGKSTIKTPAQARLERLKRSHQPTLSTASISHKSTENSQCFSPHQSNKNKGILKQNTGVICSSTDVMAPNRTCPVSAKAELKMPKTKLSNLISPMFFNGGKILADSTHNIPMDCEAHDNFEKLAKYTKDVSGQMTFKTPAQARLEKFKETHQPKAVIKEEALNVEGKVEMNVDSNFSHSIVPNDVVCMDIEYIESEVLEDIGVLRQEDKRYSTHPSIFMDVGIDIPRTHSSSLFVVLDTNILLSHLKFVEGLRDTNLPGNVLIHLYLPWQVLHELDHLKDKGKSEVQKLARIAIRFLHDNFSSKHPRVCGQKLSDFTQIASSIPDDIILQTCIQLKEQGYDIVLLSNDINLRNKALVCDVEAVSKDQFLRKLNKNLLSAKIPSNSIIQDEVLQTSNAPPSPNLTDVVLCEMKTLVKSTLSQVVAKGMVIVYQHLWQKHILKPPPWEIDDVLLCLCHHWFSICDTFIPTCVSEDISKLRHLFKTVSKGDGASIMNLTDSLELIISLFQALPNKYSNFVQVAIKNAKALKTKVDKKSPVSEFTKVLSHSGNQSSKVLLCFEEAHSEAQNLSNSESFSDPAWIQKAQSMLQSVRQLIHLIKLIFSSPIESLNENNPVLCELACLIKGASTITSGDLAEFCKQKDNRILLENGVNQFLTFDLLLSNKLQSSI